MGIHDIRARRYLRWREGQCLYGGALGRHAVAGVQEGHAGAGDVLCDRREGDLPLLLPLQHRGRGAKAALGVGGDGDELSLAAPAQVRDGVAVQAVLGDTGQRRGLAGRWSGRAGAATAAASQGLLGQVKLAQVTPPIWVLHTRESVSSSPGWQLSRRLVNWEVK